MLELLDAWVERGWLRRIDRALVRWLKELEPSTPEPLLLAAALCSHQYGRGHICLDLSATLLDADATLSLPPEGDVGEEMPTKPSELLEGSQLESWLAAIKGSPLVNSEASPLVLVENRLYLRRNYRFEQAVAGHISSRLAPMEVSPELKPQLDALFSAPGLDWQKLACGLAFRMPFTIITGGPGTGKTTTVVRLLGLKQQLALASGQKLRIGLAAPTGKAAARLTESIRGAVEKLALPQDVKAAIPVEVTTLHKLLGVIPQSRHFRHHHQNPLHLDLLVVDEASMVDLEMMSALLDALPASAQLILLGDKDQLASVEAGSVLGDLCQGADLGGYDTDTQRFLESLCGESLAAFTQGQSALAQCRAMLRVSHRFGSDSGIGQLARAVNLGQSEAALKLLRENRDDLKLLPIKDDGVALSRLAIEGYRGYLQVLSAERGSERDTWAAKVLAAFGRFQMLCALRKGPFGVEGLNQEIAEALKANGQLEADHGWYEGRPVLVTRNNYTLELMNGDVGICLRVVEADGSQRLRVAFPVVGGIKWVLPSRLSDVETVFAMTVHKSQGSEFDHTVLVLPDTLSPVLTRELVYTGITRAKRCFTLAAPKLGLLAAAVERKVERASGLREAFSQG
ncbi:exodeoxyribonuclease V subunit alpha [Gallaecimonas pentaromativorans]|uniref:RecBCD enzyme subunit RecD n=1 Tax=Gallaecimonas pentaromativorans TaxID=584787 RepID=A0A3N1PQ47_9GAMM|nr:exodeoxyribonuclease V subunit alpha [Gallaecimonas pentaromativorans]ROQ30633.1 DNA helicase/exodeoxyribonuclease V alpha subunit [Gallaecimonas pentaromativorans]